MSTRDPLPEITFYLDVVSPYAYLAFERLPQALEGLSYRVTYQPLLFAGLLKAWKTLAPVDLAPKRDWIFRQCTWIAAQDGVPFAKPYNHPFNPLALLRLALACAPAGGAPSRHVVEQVMRHAWARHGEDPNEPAALQALTAAMKPARDPNGVEVKDELRAITERAAAHGVFGVPSFRLDDGEVFWGQDSLTMLADRLRHRG
jgi:2-hydroxychromene-2-carboxylate isomerase